MVDVATGADENEDLKDAELFNYVDTSRTEEEIFHFLGFEFLHRLNIVRIQNELIETRESISGTRGRGYDKGKLMNCLMITVRSPNPSRLF